MSSFFHNKLEKLIIITLDEKEIKTLARLALKYPPATRALLGALLEQLQKDKITENPASNG